ALVKAFRARKVVGVDREVLDVWHGANVRACRCGRLSVLWRLITPMRQSRPDGSVWVRTYPLTCLHDHRTPAHAHDWDQLTYAASGVRRVHTDAASWVVPPHRAVWVPARTRHAEEMH